MYNVHFASDHLDEVILFKKTNQSHAFHYWVLLQFPAK